MPVSASNPSQASSPGPSSGRGVPLKWVAAGWLGSLAVAGFLGWRGVDSGVAADGATGSNAQSAASGGAGTGSAQGAKKIPSQTQAGKWVEFLPDTRPLPKTLADFQKQLAFADLLDYFLAGAETPSAFSEWAALLSESEFRQAIADLKAAPRSQGKFIALLALRDRWLGADPPGLLEELSKFSGEAGQDVLTETAEKWQQKDAAGYEAWLKNTPGGAGANPSSTVPPPPAPAPSPASPPATPANAAPENRPSPP
jgi:hypothetical protein